MIRFVWLIFAVLPLTACEDTNLRVMTHAAADAVSAITLTDEDVRDLAQRSAYALDSKFKVAPIGNSYDTRLRRLLEQELEWDSTKFNAKVYLTKDVNAFAMADGTIRIYSGLMDLMTDEELLFVIGHEMGHVAKEHSKRKVRLAYTTSALRKGLASQNNEVGLIAESILGALAEQLTHAQFSQYEERQADQYGAAFLKTAGVDKSAAVSALNKLALLGGQHTFLSSHPDPKARAKVLLQGENNNQDDQGSTLDRLFTYGERLVNWIYRLVRSLVHWLLSLL